MVAETGTAGAAEAKRVARGRWVGWLGRAGLVAQGFSYGIVGVLALLLALGEGGDATDRPGALRTLAGTPAGGVLLAALAAGFAGYAVWRLAQALFDRDGEGNGGTGLAKRAADGAKGLVYVGLTATTISILVQGRRGGGTDEDQATAGALGWPAGRWLVVAIGLGVAAAGAYHAYRALSAKFMDDLEAGAMGPTERRWIRRVGGFGLLARAVVFGLIGAFLVKAAVEFDPQEAIGLDGALAKLAAAAYGPLLLGATAAGLVAYGLFCVLQAVYRRL